MRNIMAGKGVFMAEKLKKMIPFFVVTGLIFIMLVGVLAFKIIEKYTPTKERVDLMSFYEITNDDEAVLFYNDEMTQDMLKIIDGTIYMNIVDVIDNLNQRYYWDSFENILIYTTNSDVIKVVPNSKEYTISQKTYEKDYEIVKVYDQDAYVALDYVKEHTKIDYEYYENPNRVYLYTSDRELSVTKAKKDTVIRQKGGIKSPIIADVKKDEKIIILSEMEDFSRVKTESGYIGYIKNKHMSDEVQSENSIISFDEVVYTGITKDYDINLVFHQVTNKDANAKIWSLMEDTSGINTICPTWFQISDSQGNIKSLADYSYVQTAHSKGYEVWGLVSNLEIDVDMYELLAHTKNRENLANQLLAEAVAYDLDGINIDFESLNSSVAESYIQFIREFAIKCHDNGIVLSIDNYVPTESTLFYNRKEQGIVADYVIIMGYDEHWGGSSESGSVASIGFVEDGIKNTLDDVPSNKVINAIPFYTRLWFESTDVNGNVTVTSKTYGMIAANELIRSKSNLVEWNEECGQYYGAYVDEDGTVCKMWLEDVKSIEEKMKLVKKYELAGVASWKLGLQDDAVWEVISQYINN